MMGSTTVSDVIYSATVLHKFCIKVQSEPSRQEFDRLLLSACSPVLEV